MLSRISSFLSSFLPQTWRLILRQHRIKRIYKSEIADAEKKGSKKDPPRIDHDWSFEADLIEEELQGIFDSRLIRKAKRLHIDMPKTSEGNWEEGRGKMCLTSATREYLRMAVREERKERREAAMFWISALFGLIGILTGLIAVLRK